MTTSCLWPNPEPRTEGVEATGKGPILPPAASTDTRQACASGDKASGGDPAGGPHSARPGPGSPRFSRAADPFPSSPRGCAPRRGAVSSCPVTTDERTPPLGLCCPCQRSQHPRSGAPLLREPTGQHCSVQHGPTACPQRPQSGQLSVGRTTGTYRKAMSSQRWRPARDAMHLPENEMLTCSRGSFLGLVQQQGHDDR